MVQFSKAVQSTTVQFSKAVQSTTVLFSTAVQSTAVLFSTYTGKGKSTIQDSNHIADIASNITRLVTVFLYLIPSNTTIHLSTAIPRGGSSIGGSTVGVLSWVQGSNF